MMLKFGSGKKITFDTVRISYTKLYVVFFAKSGIFVQRFTFHKNSFDRIKRSCRIDGMQMFYDRTIQIPDRQIISVYIFFGRGVDRQGHLRHFHNFL